MSRPARRSTVPSLDPRSARPDRLDGSGWVTTPSGCPDCGAAWVGRDGGARLGPLPIPFSHPLPVRPARALLVRPGYGRLDPGHRLGIDLFGPIELVLSHCASLHSSTRPAPSLPSLHHPRPRAHRPPPVGPPPIRSAVSEPSRPASNPFVDPRRSSENRRVLLCSDGFPSLDRSSGSGRRSSLGSKRSATRRTTGRRAWTEAKTRSALSHDRSAATGSGGRG